MAMGERHRSAPSPNSALSHFLILLMLFALEYKQDEEENGAKGWAIFGVLSCIYMTLNVWCPLFACLAYSIKYMHQILHSSDIGERRIKVFHGLRTFYIVISTLVCCGGFVYKSRVQNQRGLDALPGMTILSACLETMSGGGGQSYARPEDLNSPFANQASWSRQPAAPQGASRTSDRKYGAI